MTTETTPTSPWRPIETAPQQGHIDIWAKIWLPQTDTFATRRFTDCWRYPGDSMTNNRPRWIGVDAEWRATHWMPIPDGPF